MKVLVLSQGVVLCRSSIYHQTVFEYQLIAVFERWLGVFVSEWFYRWNKYIIAWVGLNNVMFRNRHGNSSVLHGWVIRPLRKVSTRVRNVLLCALSWHVLLRSAVGFSPTRFLLLPFQVLSELLVVGVVRIHGQGRPDQNGKKIIWLETKHLFQKWNL